MANVSYSTVSRAVSGSAKVSESTRETILKICSEKGFRINTLARSMVKKRTNVIGVIIPNITNPFYSEIVLHIDRHARRLGYICMICNGMYDDVQIEDLLEFMMSQQVDGIILASPRDSTCERIEKYTSQIPIVYIGVNPGQYSGNFVNTNNKLGGYMACEYLYRLGHRDIVYFGYREGSSTHSDRLEGFQQAAQAFGIRPTVLYNNEGHSTIEAGYRLGLKLLNSKNKFSAVFVVSDTLALGLLQAAEENGIAIPESFSMLGYDNISYSNLPKIHLTSVAQPLDQIAVNAVDILLDAVRKQDLDNFMNRSLNPFLVERNSCLPND